MICKICNNSKNNKEFKMKEMMFGLRDEFLYYECAECGHLQISTIPENIEEYYPLNYCSFRTDSIIKRIIKRKRDEYALFKKGLIGKLIYKKYPNRLLDIFSELGVNCNTRILDIGCGAGSLLYFLNKVGFNNLTGVEPYVDEIKDGDVEIVKNIPRDKNFDLIYLNHSFEHIPDQLETLLVISKILSEDGTCIIRMPIKTEYIWNRYGINWVQIDAPRHFFLHTLKSFEILVKKCGLVIQDETFDSSEFQFLGSEQYEKNIPLEAGNSYFVNPRNSVFTRKRINEFKELSKKLNMNKQGDQASFRLAKISN